jgi:hypothetical protein
MREVSPTSAFFTGLNDMVSVFPSSRKTPVHGDRSANWPLVQGEAENTVKIELNEICRRADAVASIAAGKACSA